MVIVLKRHVFTAVPLWRFLPEPDMLCINYTCKLTIGIRFQKANSPVTYAQRWHVCRNIGLVPTRVLRVGVGGKNSHICRSFRVLTLNPKNVMPPQRGKPHQAGFILTLADLFNLT
jgi:hypothetical protein